MKARFLCVFATVVAIALAHVDKSNIRGNQARDLAERELREKNEFIATFSCHSKRECRSLTKKLRDRTHKYCSSPEDESTEFEIVKENLLVDFIIFTCVNPGVLGISDSEEDGSTGVIDSHEYIKIYETQFKNIDGVGFTYERNQLVATADYRWNLDRIDQRTLPLLRDDFQATYTGYGVTIYIVDTGINKGHVEFTNRAIYGGDFISESWDEDYHGHGSHCAGIAAGKTTGVANEAQVIGVKVLGRGGFGTTASVVAGIIWAMDHAAGVQRPGVISISIGAGKSTVIDDTVKAAAESNIVVVAGGNDDSDACQFSPSRAGGNAAQGGPIAVGATDIEDKRASFSNYGSCIDMWAPGVKIVSAWRISKTELRSLSGTSMATPMVAGVGALLLQKHNFNKNLAQKELVNLVAKGHLKRMRGSPNKLLQVPEDTPDEIPSTPTPYPTFGPVRICVGRRCTRKLEPALFGPRPIAEIITGKGVRVKDLCTTLPSQAYEGKVVFIKRNSRCKLFDMVINAQKADAVAVVVVNNRGGPVPIIYREDDAHLASIPSLMVGKRAGRRFLKSLRKRSKVVKYGHI